jgi:hypothetical protein
VVAFFGDIYRKASGALFTYFRNLMKAWQGIDLWEWVERLCGGQSRVSGIVPRMVPQSLTVFEPSIVPIDQVMPGKGNGASGFGTGGISGVGAGLSGVLPFASPSTMPRSPPPLPPPLISSGNSSGGESGGVSDLAIAYTCQLLCDAVPIVFDTEWFRLHSGRGPPDSYSRNFTSSSAYRTHSAVSAEIGKTQSCASCVNSIARDSRESSVSWYSIVCDFGFIIIDLVTLSAGCAFGHGRAFSFGSGSDRITLPSVAGGALDFGWAGAESVSRGGVCHVGESGNSGLATWVPVFALMTDSFGSGSDRMTLPSVAGGALDFGRARAKTVSRGECSIGSGFDRAMTLPSVAGGALDLPGQARIETVLYQEVRQGSACRNSGLATLIPVCGTMAGVYGLGSDRVITLPSVAGGALDSGWARAETASGNDVCHGRERGDSGLATGVPFFSSMAGYVGKRLGSGLVGMITLPSVAGGALDISGRARTVLFANCQKEACHG